MELAIFPLRTVLFPGGVLPLKIFEQRYIAMAKECISRDVPFGLCLIAEGEEVGAPALPHPVGSSARIAQWEMPQLGVLQVLVRGEQRFRILTQAADAQGLIRASADWIAEGPAMAIPAKLRGLIPLLEAIVADAGPARVAAPHAFDDAAWVGYRYCEILPIQNLARQKLLELADPLSRLEIIFEYLSQRGLVSSGG